MSRPAKVWKFGPNIDTDVIFPARYLNLSEPAEMGRHCLEDAAPDFVRQITAGDVIVAGRNFGCGSSREQAPIAIKAAGVSCVIAASFSRIFYRNAINIGLPIFECEPAPEGLQEGHELEIDASSGQIRNLANGEVYQAAPFPPFMQALIKAGGLTPYVKNIITRRPPPENSAAGGHD